MSNSLKIDLNNLGNSGLDEVLKTVEKACLSLNVDFYIIGALAKDIWFTFGDIAPGGTKDIDFAVFVNSEQQFLDLKDFLIHKFDYKDFKGNSFILFSPEKIQIDIIPFGAIEVEEGVTVKGEGLNHIKVNGFTEVFEKAVMEVRLLGENHYKVATLPGIVLLKLISYDDRPDQRSKDPVDIINIIRNYFSLQSDLIYDEHNDLFDEDVSLSDIAARVIGREIRKPLSDNEKLSNRVTAILNDHIIKGENSNFILNMIESSDKTVDEYVHLLTMILKGINDPITK